MTKILVIYSSVGGHTQMLAEAIADGVKEVKGSACLVKRVSDVVPNDLISADGIIAGSPVYFGSMSAELKDMFDKNVSIRRKMEGKVGAAFATAGHHTGGKETTMLSIIQAMLIYGMIIVGDPISAGGHYGVACVGTPDNETINAAKELGKRVVDVAGKIIT